MINRYPDIPGCRLDSGEDGMEGPALDLYPGRKVNLWVRESGRAEGKSARVTLSTEDLVALYNGIGRVLTDAGATQLISMAVLK